MTATSKADLLAAFARVQSRAESLSLGPDSFAVEGVENGYYVGSSGRGALALLAETVAAASQPPPTRLENLLASYGDQCELHDEAGLRVVRVSRLVCQAPGASTAELFSTVCLTVIDRLGPKPTERAFADEIARWATLFWRLGQSVSTDIVGLIGELAVMRCGAHPAAWVRAWHSNPSDTLDFEFGDTGTAVEVKATRGSSREHQVALEQVSDPGDAPRYLASVLVRFSDSGGESLGDLVRDLSDRLDDDGMRFRLWDILARTCGSGLEETLARRIETAGTISSVEFYPAWLVPRPTVSLPLPSGVRSVKFVSDFATVEPANVDLVLRIVGA